ncbi:MAG TPA: glycosyltransferase family 87 protein [Planctomycetota bacterium]
MKRTRLWLLPVLLAILVGGGYYFTRRAKASDRELPVYVTGAARMAAREEIYRRGTDAKPFTYPPFAAVPFLPMCLISPQWQPAAWFAVNFLILWLLVRWLHGIGRRELPGTGPPRIVWFWILTVLVGGRHVLSVLTNQSHDLLIAGLVAMTASAWCKGSRGAGVWAGVGGAVKATPLLFVGLFLLRKKVAAAVFVVLTFLGLSLLPDWWFPRADGGFWLKAWYDVNLRGLDVGGTASAPGAWNSHSVLNQSLTGTLTRLFVPVATPDTSFVIGDTGAVLLFELPSVVFRVVSLLAQLGVLALIVLGIRAAARVVRGAADAAAALQLVGLGEVAAIACGMVLLSPQSSKSHFCVWVFPAAFVVDRLLRTKRDTLAIVLLVLAAVTGFCSKELLGTGLGNSLLGYGNVTWCTLLLLLATVRCLRKTTIETTKAPLPKPKTMLEKAK